MSRNKNLVVSVSKMNIHEKHANNLYNDDEEAIMKSLAKKPCRINYQGKQICSKVEKWNEQDYYTFMALQHALCIGR